LSTKRRSAALLGSLDELGYRIPRRRRNSAGSGRRSSGCPDSRLRCRCHSQSSSSARLHSRASLPGATASAGGQVFLVPDGQRTILRVCGFGGDLASVSGPDPGRLAVHPDRHDRAPQPALIPDEMAQAMGSSISAGRGQAPGNVDW
jgi:hypothetical protein